jgi:hypothetical protein
MRNTNKNSVGKPEAKRAVGRPRHRGEDNIKMYLTEIGLEGGYRACRRELVKTVPHLGHRQSGVNVLSSSLHY